MSAPSVSFIHFGDPTMASYRYRCTDPASWLDASLNDATADILVFCKPVPSDVAVARQIQATGRHVIVDFCDNHFDRHEYNVMAQLADAITCPTAAMAQTIRFYTGRRDAVVIPEAYALPESPPHCTDQRRLFWFGHSSNLPNLIDVSPWLGKIRIMSNVKGTLPWSLSALREELSRADIVVLPATAPYKSPNRAVEAIRAGCFVVAEPHRCFQDWFAPSRENLYITTRLEDGIKWATENPVAANADTARLQTWIAQHYSPDRIAGLWRKLLASVSALPIHAH